MPNRIAKKDPRSWRPGSTGAAGDMNAFLLFLAIGLGRST